METNSCVRGLVYTPGGGWAADKAPRLRWATKTVNTLIKKGWMIKTEDGYLKSTIEGRYEAHKFFAGYHKRVVQRFEKRKKGAF